jgi:hypothetical protein
MQLRLKRIKKKKIVIFTRRIIKLILNILLIIVIVLMDHANLNKIYNLKVVKITKKNKYFSKTTFKKKQLISKSKSKRILIIVLRYQIN